MISERTLDMEEELCAWFIDWQKVFDSVIWKKINAYPEGKWYRLARKGLISKLHMDYSVKTKLDEGKTESLKIGSGVIQKCCSSPIIFKLHS
jgi:hypothetical protein